jgi:hypothetical protein
MEFPMPKSIASAFVAGDGTSLMKEQCSMDLASGARWGPFLLWAF